jgi:hypothetical protein
MKPDYFSLSLAQQADWHLQEYMRLIELVDDPTIKAEELADYHLRMMDSIMRDLPL